MSKNTKAQQNNDTQGYDLKSKLIRINRTTKVVKGGRVFNISATVVVGDGKSRVGIGHAKAKEVPTAIQKATKMAEKKMIHVALKGNTIQHSLKARHGATTVFMQPASEGTGVIAGGAMRHIFECLGVADVLGKCIGSSNPSNVAQATLKGLMSMKDPMDVANKRGMSVKQVLGIKDEAEKSKTA